MKTIQKIIFNWYQAGSVQDRDGAGEDCSFFEVGKNNVVEIREHAAQGEGDKWYYDVIFENGSFDRIFNPNYVEFRDEL